MKSLLILTLIAFASSTVNAQTMRLKRPFRVLEKGDTIRAMGIINKRIQRTESAALYKLRGEIKQQRGDLHEALVDYQTYCIEQPCGSVQLNKAKIYYKLNDFDAAIDALLSFPRLNKSADALKLLGICQMHSEKYQEALETFDKVLALEPRDFKALYNAGVAAYQLSKIDIAQSHFTDASNALPGDESVWVALGLCHFEMEEYEASNKAYRQAIAINSENHQALVNIGVNYYQLGDHLNTCKYWQRASKAGSKSAQLKIGRYCSKEHVSH